MFDYNLKLNQFYNNHVRLRDIDKVLIREYKDKNIARIISGINKINQEENKSYPTPIFIEQGSISMSTTNQSSDNDYDIDVAVIFPKNSIFNNPLDARKFVAKAINKSNVNFSKPVEARTNAVTVWYTQGYHVDFAVYRSYTDFFIDKYEHASAQWVDRDPKAVTKWFLQKVSNLSPSGNFVSVEKSQFRKIVRLLKKFCKSRLNWDLPGGFILSILAAECYYPHNSRDDISFIQTLLNIKNRLLSNRIIFNPTNNIELTSKKSLRHKLTRLYEKLDQFASKSSILFQQDCDIKSCEEFYKWVFGTALEIETFSRLKENTHSKSLSVSVHKSKDLGSIMSNIPNGTLKIHKKLWLKFTLSTNIIPPFDIKWIVENDGDEALSIPDLGHESWDFQCQNKVNYHWERTAYKGIHRLRAEIHKDGNFMEEHLFEVKVIN